MIETMELAILLGSVLVIVAIFTSLISFRLGAPLLLVLLLLGLIAGEDGLLRIDFDDGPTAYFIGSIALAIILFDSGFATRLASVRSALLPAVTLATVGTMITALAFPLCNQTSASCSLASAPWKLKYRDCEKRYR